MQPASHTLYGYRIVTDPTLTKLVSDWSRVRSPARATRRMKRGFRQNITTREQPSDNVYQLGDTLLTHPETLGRLQRVFE